MITVFGTVCLDRVRRIAQWPSPGGYQEIQDEHLFLGGEAANTAVALQAWGEEVVLWGNAIGRDADGELLRALLGRRDLGACVAVQHDVPTPVCDIYVTPNGDRTMFGYGFARMDATVDPGSVAVRAGEWMTAEPNMGRVAREVVRRAASGGMRVYLMDFIQEDEPLRPGDVWQGSTDWIGERGQIDRNLAVARTWAERYGVTAILSDGSNGLAFAQGDRAVWLPAFPSPPVVDTTGAGDTFRAGVLRGLARGENWPTVLAFAAAAGALCCQYLGACETVPSREDIEAYLEAHRDVVVCYADRVG